MKNRKQAKKKVIIQMNKKVKPTINQKKLLQI